MAGAGESGLTATQTERKLADRAAARPRDRRAAESEAEDARPLNRSSETPAHEFLWRRSPPAPKNYIRPLHRDGAARRPDAPGQSLRGSRKCGPDSSGLAGSVTVSRPNARGSSYAKRDYSPRRSGQCRRNTDRDTDRWAFRPASGARARFLTSRAGRTWTAARLGSKDSPATRRA